MNAPPLRPDPDPAQPATPEPYRSLSALADGQTDALDAACALWRDDPQARRHWHTLHLIGDVLRSEDLASTPARDAAFLAGVRARLAAEPVPLAPAPVAASRRGTPAMLGRLGWRAPAAVAAGFAVVAVVVVVTRGDGAGAGERSGMVLGASGGLQPAAVTVTGTPVAAGAAGVAGGSGPASLVTQGGQIRDPRLDAQLESYLRAHQAARGGAAVLPGGALRNAEMVVLPQPAVGAASAQPMGPSR